MTTVRQIERMWSAGQFPRLVGQMLEARPEASDRLRERLGPSVAAAALVIIRLSELRQDHAPMIPRLIRAIVREQRPDGGWGDPLTTAVCVRALMCADGEGKAIDDALRYLAQTQRADGLWSSAGGEPGRPAADPFITAAVLYYLASDGRFQQAVRMSDAVEALESMRGRLDEPTRRLWRAVSLRCRAMCSVADRPAA